MKQMVNGIFIVLGFAAFGMGILGSILPLLPATPFFMLAAVCFAKGSKRFHTWFTGTGFYNTYVVPAVKSKAMDRKTKRKTLLILCLIFLVSFMVMPVWQAKAVILIVAAGHVYYFTFRIRTVSVKNAAAAE